MFIVPAEGFMKNLKILTFIISTLTFIAGCGKITEDAGTGTPDTKWYSDNPKATVFTISNADELAGLAQIVNGTWGGVPERDDFSGKTVRLSHNIDLSIYDNWMPIGYAAVIDFRERQGKPFSGTFDGRGFIIKNLTINRPDSNCQGLFGYIGGAEVKNLGLDNVDIRGGRHVGGLTGFIDSGSIANCWVTGKVTGAMAVGGLAGCVNGDIQSGGSFGRFVDKAGNIQYTPEAAAAAGLQPAWRTENKSSVANCYFTGTVSGGNYAGGIAGSVNNSDVVNSYSTGVVSGEDNVGGVIGVIGGESSAANNYAANMVTGNSCVGGVVGYISGSIGYGGYVGYGDCNGGGSGTSGVNSCAALNPQVEVTGARAGRVVGCCRGGGLPISNNIAYAGMINNTGDTLWSNKGAHKPDGADMTAAAIGTDKTLGGRFTDVGNWTTKEGNLPGFGTAAVFPAHFGMSIHRVAVSPANVLVVRGGTQPFSADVFGKAADKTVIWAVSGNLSPSTNINAAGLLSIAENEISESLTVTAMSKVNDAALGTAVVMTIDTEMYNRYAWYLDSIAVNPKANRFTISTADELAGLAQIVNGTWGGWPAKDNFTGKIIKLADNIDLSAYDNWVPIGIYRVNMFSGTFDGSGKIISNLTIDSPNANFLGLFGSINRGRVENLRLVNVDISGGSHVGAIAGIIECSTFVVNSYSTGKVSGNDDVGGILGNVDCSVVNNSYSTCTVSGNDGIGGVAGAFSCPRWGMGGRRYSCMGCYSSTEINVTNSYFTGRVSGRNQVGGVVGDAYGGSVNNSYSTAPVSGTHRVGGVVGSLKWSNLNNSWSTGAVSGDCWVGGIAGDVWGHHINSCAALNPEVKSTGKCAERAAINNPTGAGVGRVAGSTGNTKFTNNIAYIDNVTSSARNTVLKDADFRHGANITATKITADPTLGGRFTKDSGWTVRAGNLPGIGAAVRMPPHLRTD